MLLDRSSYMQHLIRHAPRQLLHKAVLKFDVPSVLSIRDVRFRDLLLHQRSANALRKTLRSRQPQHTCLHDIISIYLRENVGIADAAICPRHRCEFHIYKPPNIYSIVNPRS